MNVKMELVEGKDFPEGTSEEKKEGFALFVKRNLTELIQSETHFDELNVDVTVRKTAKTTEIQ